MWKALSKMSKNLVIAIPTMMLIGFIYGLNFDARFLKRLIIPLHFSWYIL